MQIGFGETTYIVDESAGKAIVTASILTGSISDDIVVEFKTMERSAEGTGYMYTGRMYCMYMYVVRVLV